MFTGEGAATLGAQVCAGRQPGLINTPGRLGPAAVRIVAVDHGSSKQHWPRKRLMNILGIPDTISVPGSNPALGRGM